MSLSDEQRVSVRSLSLAELGLVLQWAQNMDWNPLLGCARSMKALDPLCTQGVFVGDELVAACSGLRYNDEMGFVGLYICREEFRGKGLGLKAWNAALAHLDDLCCVGLDAVFEQRKNYEKCGFKGYYVHRRLGLDLNKLVELVAGRGQRLGVTVSLGLAELQGGPGVSCCGADGVSADIVDWTDVDLGLLADFDARYALGERGRVLAELMACPPETRGGFVLVETDAKGTESIQGYVSYVKAATTGYRLSPLVAEREDVALKLLWAAVQAIVRLDAAAGDRPAGKPLTLFTDVPEGANWHLFESMGAWVDFECQRMYKGNVPKRLLNPVLVEKIFGIVSMEIG